MMSVRCHCDVRLTTTVSYLDDRAPSLCRQGMLSYITGDRYYFVLEQSNV